MKQVFLLVLLSSTCFAATAQTWEEWSEQKQTQLKYLLQQIAALKVYAESAQKGYAIARDELNLIQDIKDGDFHLHSDYINSMKTVNEKVTGYAKVAAIIAMQFSMKNSYRKTYNQLIESNQLNKSELDYYKAICIHLLQQSADNLERLNQVLANGYFKMRDDERLKHIDTVYADMVDQATFLKSFNNDMKALAMQRLKGNEDLKNLQLLYGVK